MAKARKIRASQVLKGRKLRASMGYRVIIGDGDFIVNL